MNASGSLRRDMLRMSAGRTILSMICSLGKKRIIKRESRGYSVQDGEILPPRLCTYGVVKGEREQEGRKKGDAERAENNGRGEVAPLFKLQVQQEAYIDEQNTENDGRQYLVEVTLGVVSPDDIPER